MKKLVILLLLSVFVLSSCGKDNEEDMTTTEDGVTIETSDVSVSDEME